MSSLSHPLRRLDLSSLFHTLVSSKPVSATPSPGSDALTRTVTIRTKRNANSSESSVYVQPQSGVAVPIVSTAR